MDYTELLEESARIGEDPFLAEFQEVDVVRYHRQRGVAQQLMNGYLNEGGFGGRAKIGNYDPTSPNYKEESLSSNGFHFDVYAVGEGENAVLPEGLGRHLVSKGCVLDNSNGGLSARGRVLHIRVPFGLVEAGEANGAEVIEEIEDIRRRQRGNGEVCVNCLP